MLLNSIFEAGYKMIFFGYFVRSGLLIAKKTSSFDSQKGKF